MADSQDGKLFIKTSDGVVSEVKKETILLATAVNEMLNALQNGDAKELELPKIDSQQLAVAVEWIENHIGKPDYDWSVDDITGERNWPELSKEDSGMLEPLELEDYSRLLEAAHYLGIESLRWATAQSLAGKIKDKSADFIRAYLNEPDDLTAAEKDAIRREDKWSLL